MADSIIMERVADAAADCFYSELIKTEDFQAFEALVSADMRTIAAGVLRRCIKRFDAGLSSRPMRRLRRGSHGLHPEKLNSHCFLPIAAKNMLFCYHNGKIPRL